MNRDLSNIVSNGFRLIDCIDVEKLQQLTQKVGPALCKNIPWEQLRHLYILGVEGYEGIKELKKEKNIRRGFYLDDSGSWLLIVGPPQANIQEYVSCCGPQLETLTVRFTTVSNLKVGHLSEVKELNLSANKEFVQISGLEELNELEELTLDDTNVGPILNLRSNDVLARISIDRTQISKVEIDHPLMHLRIFSAEKSGIEETAFLRFFPNLHFLDLDGTSIISLSSLGQLRKLHYVYVNNTQISSLDNVEFPEIINTLALSGTAIRYLPNTIGRLKNLEYLNLSYLKLEELPDWLPELGLEFTRDYVTNGINLCATEIKGIDMSIFSQPREVILKWFEDRKRNAGAPLNEVKVVFLGDGEAGKSHTIARLLNDGGDPVGFTGDATPGIVIQNKDYPLDDRQIQVHFWDFGGQEILHSMHRIFLTERTLYVVLLNARDNTQNERARYWLHNIKSFAGDVPVLLVLNKTDQNEYATVNVSDLREICPSLPEAVRLSAKDDSPAEFNRKLTNAMLDEIRKIDTLNTFFPNSWKRVKSELENMKTPYIKGDAYKRLCIENQVDEKIQKDVLNLFKTLGVSFYYPGAKLEDYVVLRPDWITNAIYIILFNKRDEVKNGIISHETIYRLLNPEAGDSVKRVLPDVVYDPAEVAYVLDVVRRFRLSYLVEDGVEFIPMLCASNSLPVAAEYANDLNTLEFRMIYDYLPNNVLHRLMVELRRDLDRDNVWLTGARFAEISKGFSAVVKSEGNVLRIFVRAEKKRYTADMYLDTIKSALERINRDMGLEAAQNQVVYKADGIAECFDYDDLLLSQELGDTEVVSRARRKKIPIQDILSQTDHSVDQARERLIRDVLRACRELQANQLYWKAKEDDRNTYIRDMLRARDYIVADQSRSGISAGGKQAGELDLDIRREPNTPWTIYEALNLTGQGVSQIAYWDGHLKKLLDNYNANGLPFLIHVSYMECAKDKFGSFCSTYYDHLRSFGPELFSLQSTGAVRTTSEEYGESHFMQAYQCIYDCGGFPTTVYHIFVRLGA